MKIRKHLKIQNRDSNVTNCQNKKLLHNLLSTQSFCVASSVFFFSFWRVKNLTLSISLQPNSYLHFAPSSWKYLKFQVTKLFFYKKYYAIFFSNLFIPVFNYFTCFHLFHLALSVTYVSNCNFAPSIKAKAETMRRRKERGEKHSEYNRASTSVFLFSAFCI